MEGMSIDSAKMENQEMRKEKGAVLGMFGFI